MSNTLAIGALGVEELDARMLVEVGGGEGSGWGDLAWYLLRKTAECIIDNWGEFKEGFSEGWNNPV